jgi:hypothetical protein
VDLIVARAEERRTDLAILALAGLAVAVAILADPGTEGIRLFGHEIPTLCLFRLLTGWPCPGCGLTRSFAFTAHLQFLQAFRMHPLGPPLFAFTLYQLGFRAIRLVGPVAGGPWKRRPQPGLDASEHRS